MPCSQGTLSSVLAPNSNFGNFWGYSGLFGTILLVRFGPGPVLVIIYSPHSAHLGPDLIQNTLRRYPLINGYERVIAPNSKNNR